MERSRFDDYIARFNREDPTAFDEFLTPDMKMLNGALEFEGIAGMRDHYQNRIWPHFVERLNVLRFVSSDTNLAIQMWTKFIARVDGDTLFGNVLQGEEFDYRGLIMYDIRDGKFSNIIVSYNSFTSTNLDGKVTNLGIPH